MKLKTIYLLNISLNKFLLNKSIAAIGSNIFHRNDNNKPSVKSALKEADRYVHGNRVDKFWYEFSQLILALDRRDKLKWKLKMNSKIELDIITEDVKT